MATNEFWRKLDILLSNSMIVIDRPKGKPHPRSPETIYPYDYGYLEGTQSGDGAGIDVWVGSQPERKITAIVCTVDMQKRDSEIKLLVGCTAEEAREIRDFHENGGQSALLIERPREGESDAA